MAYGAPFEPRVPDQHRPAGHNLPKRMRNSPSTVADLMTPAPQAIHGLTTVAAAIDLISTLGAPGLPVVENDHLIGFITPIQLLRKPLYRTVAEAMSKDVIPATPDLPLSYAYDLLARQQAEVLPVVDHGRLVGLISLTAILEARHQERDPLTGLPWAASLRNWAMGALGRGEEVVILFVDLDNFGIVNKALGHVVGDDILRSVGYLLSAALDPSTDFICRYGGDEFAIATTRRVEDATALAQRLRETVNLPVEIEGRQERVTASVGFAGGRRVEPRTAAHIAATVDDLLTLASRGSTLAKESGQGIVHHTRREEERDLRQPGRRYRRGEIRLRLDHAVVSAEPHQSVATVALGLGDRVVHGTAAARISGRAVPLLVADATLAAIAQVIASSSGFLLEDLSLMPSENETVAVAVLAGAPGQPERLVGSARAADAHLAVSRAVLDALNRRLSRILEGMLQRDPEAQHGSSQTGAPSLQSIEN